jgi:hypothetical protein
MLPLLLATASPAIASGLDVRLGAFVPRARDCGVPLDQPPNYTLFQDVCDLFFVSKSDWVGFTGGVEYNHVIARNVEVAVHVDGYGRSINTSYRDWTRPDGSDIFQTLRLQVVPFGVTLQIVPTRKRTKVAPFAGGGVDLFYWKYEEFGDFIDFVDPDLPIYADHFIADGVTFGFHATGGVRFYLNRDFALVVRGAYQWAGTDMGDDFSPNEPGLINRIDLSGASVTFGLHVRF